MVGWREERRKKEMKKEKGRKLEKKREGDRGEEKVRDKKRRKKGWGREETTKSCVPYSNTTIAEVLFHSWHIPLDLADVLCQPGEARERVMGG
jgi:hypothetical protein